MSINLRIIPRLDIRNNKLIKPFQLEGVKEIGNPETFAYNYYKQNADEILIMDVVASLYSRNNKADIVKKISNKVLVPVIVGGGIRNLDDAEILFNSGADKIALNTAVFDSPNLIKKLSQNYSIVIVEHDMEVIYNLANRIYVLDRGKIIFNGNVKEIKSSKLVQDRYLGQNNE